MNYILNGKQVFKEQLDKLIIINILIIKDLELDDKDSIDFYEDLL